MLEWKETDVWNCVDQLGPGDVFGEEAILSSLAVEKHARGVGYGWMLADTAVAVARHRGVKRIYLLTPETASDFFAEKLGFRVVDRATVSDAVASSTTFRHELDRSPDAIGGDGIYSGVVNFSLMRVEGGYFELSLSAVDESGNPSNTLKERILVFRSSRAPYLSGLSAPDTVVLPPPNLVSLILLSITANDSDGLEDIEEVFFRNLDSPSDTTRKFFMYDDGDVNGVSGDSVSGDGVFRNTRRWIGHKEERIPL